MFPNSERLLPPTYNYFLLPLPPTLWNVTKFWTHTGADTLFGIPNIEKPTTSVPVAEEREPPHVREIHREPDDGEQEVHALPPRLPVSKRSGGIITQFSEIEAGKII